MLIWSQELIELARTYKTPETSYAQAASELSIELGLEINPEQLRGALRRASSKVVSRVPENLQTVTEPPIHLKDANFVYASDFHVPFHDREMVERLITVAEKHHSGISTLVLGGDFFDMGAASFHLHDESQPITMEEELRIGGDLLFELMHHWSTVVMLCGNHEARVQKRLGTAFNLQRLIYAALGGRSVDGCELKISSYDWATAGDSWLMGHPSNFSGRGGQVPVDIALIRQTNVIGAHNHRYGIQASACGRWIGVDGGCMTSGALHWYKERRLNKFNEWTTGFVVVEDSYAKTYPGPFTNWRALGAK